MNNFSLLRCSIGFFWTGLLLLLLPFSADALQENPHDFAAWVNGVPISKAKLNLNLKIVLRKKKLDKTTLKQEELQSLEAKTLDELVDRELLFQESSRLGMRVDQQLVNQQYDLMKKMYPTPQMFAEKLASVSLSETDLKQQVARGLAIRKLIHEKVVILAKTSEEESRRFYKKNQEQFKLPELIRAQHILISYPPNTGPAEKQKVYKQLERIRRRILRGEDFSTMARKFSTDYTAKIGGELGYFDHNKMIEPFTQAAFNLKINEVSDIVQTDYGCHLIKLLDRKPSRIPPFEEIQQDVTQLVEQKKIANGIKSYVEILRQKGEIVIPENSRAIGKPARDAVKQ